MLALQQLPTWMVVRETLDSMPGRPLLMRALFSVKSSLSS